MLGGRLWPIRAYTIRAIKREKVHMKEDKITKDNDATKTTKNSDALSSNDQAKLSEDMAYMENEPAAAGTFGESIGSVGSKGDDPALNADDFNDEKLKDF